MHELPRGEHPYGRFTEIPDIAGDDSFQSVIDRDKMLDPVLEVRKAGTRGFPDFLPGKRQDLNNGTDSLDGQQRLLGASFTGPSPAIVLSGGRFWNR